MAINANLISALGAGSGVDVKSLAEGLVGVEREPRKRILDDRIAKSEAKISGYSVVMAALDNLKVSLDKLKDKSDFNSLTVLNSNPESFVTVAGADALPSQNNIRVVSLARGQSAMPESFASSNESLNSGLAFSLQLSIDGASSQTIRIAPGQPQRQLLAFTGATDAGEILVAGVSVAIAAGDSASVISGKVAAALSGEAFFQSEGRQVQDNGDGSVAVTFSLSDESPSEIEIAGTQPLGIQAAAAVQRGFVESFTTPSGIVKAINAAGLGVTAQVLDTGNGSATPFRIVVTGNTGAKNGFSLTSDDGSGLGEQQTLAFGAATANGEIIVAGVRVAVEAGDTAAEVAEKVTVALDASDFMRNTVGRSVTDLGNGLVEITFAGSDGDMPMVVFADADITAVTFSVAESRGFSLGNTISALLFQTPPGLEASDAEIQVNGLTVFRPSNTVTDVVQGATLTLRATSTTASTVVFERDPSSIRASVKEVIEKFNDMVSDFKILTGEKSDDPEDIFSGSLTGESTIRLIQRQMRDLLFGRSSTPGAVVTSLADIGVSVNRNGVASLDETVFDTKVSKNFNDVVLMFSANTSDQSDFGSANRGLAGDAVKKINDLLSQRGFLQTQTNNAEEGISRSKRALETLEARMEQLLTRYMKQFAVMETIVGQSNSLRESLKGQFESLSAMYNNK